MDQAVALLIGCPSHKQVLGLVDAWVALEERVALADLKRHLLALRIDAQLALVVVGAIAAGLHNIASTAVCAMVALRIRLLRATTTT